MWRVSILVCHLPSSAGENRRLQGPHPRPFCTQRAVHSGYVAHGRREEVVGCSLLPWDQWDGWELRDLSVLSVLLVLLVLSPTTYNLLPPVTPLRDAVFWQSARNNPWTGDCGEDADEF